MKKILKADEIKFVFPGADAIAKADYAQLIVAAKRGAEWAGTENALAIHHADAADGDFAEFKEFVLAPGASEVVQFQVNLAGVKDFFKFVADEDVFVIDAILADDADVDAADVEELPVPAVIHPTL